MPPSFPSQPMTVPHAHQPIPPQPVHPSRTALAPPVATGQASLPPPPPKVSKFDHRGNVVKAVQRESTWATQVFRHLTPSQTQDFVGHLNDLIVVATRCRNERAQQLRQASPEEAAAQMRAFAPIDAIVHTLDEWSMKNGTAADLADRTIGNRQYKMLVDLVVEHQIAAARPLYDAMRTPAYFTDRGRAEVPVQSRRNSIMDRHAGITSSLHRTPSTENFFSNNTFHAKAMLVRLPDSETAKRFTDSGTPFIGGVSGSGQALGQMLEMERPFAQRTPREKALAEFLILTHAAHMTLGGHHSIMETVLSVRQLGLFADIPDPLREGGSYRKTMRALEAKARALGFQTPARLG
ncbi:hypothetical protein [Pandoraea anhela]|nr:hypothetical protein [Pandoraea anhela]